MGSSKTFFSRLPIHKWKSDFHSTRKLLFYMCVLPATEKLKFYDKEHLIFMVRLTYPDKNEIAVSQSYFTIAGL